jgi:hypothetical protein
MLNSRPEVFGKWCAPTAIGILTGRPYTETKSRCAFISNTAYSEVEGVWTEESILALNEFGYTSIPVDLQARYDTSPPTLQRYMMERPFEERAEPLLVQVWGHLLTVHMNWACDNWTKKVVPFDQFPKPRRKVMSVHIIRRRIQ